MVRVPSLGFAAARRWLQCAGRQSVRCTVNRGNRRVTWGEETTFSSTSTSCSSVRRSSPVGCASRSVMEANWAYVWKRDSVFVSCARACCRSCAQPPIFAVMFAVSNRAVHRVLHDLLANVASKSHGRVIIAEGGPTRAHAKHPSSKIESDFENRNTELRPLFNRTPTNPQELQSNMVRCHCSVPLSQQCARKENADRGARSLPAKSRPPRSGARTRRSSRSNSMT